MNLFTSTGVECFPIQHAARDKLKSKKLSAVKLYCWLCSASQHGSLTATAASIATATSLDEDTIQAARTELASLRLIAATLEPGQGARYRYTIPNLQTRKPFRPAEHAGAGYFHCPRLYTLSEAYKSNGAVTAVYLTVLANANRLNSASLRYSKSKLAGIAGLTHKTTAKALSALTAGEFPFLRVETGLVEILNPSGGSLAEKSSSYGFIDRATGRAGSVQQLLTPESYNKYFSQELPDLDPDNVQQDVCCPFHADKRPSMSVNLDSGVWKCHVCAGAEGGLIDFEMRLLDTEDGHLAWKSIAKKLGVKLLPRNPGRQTGQHTYHDAHGEALYQVRRYEDGSARFYTQGITGKWRRGLKGVKRVPYNLQQLVKADVAILTEGERKSDQVQELGLLDANGNSIAVTCTGGATSWRTEFAEHFAKKCVLVLRDSDEPGERYANAVSASFTHAGIEHEVIDFDAYGNDVRDYLKDRSAAELVDYIGSEWLAARNVPTLEGV